MAFAVTIVLLIVALCAAGPVSATPRETTPKGQHEAAVKRLQRQRAHMERQRERIQKNRRRFKEHNEHVRALLKKEAQTAKNGGSGADADDVVDDKTDADKTDADDDHGGSEVWSSFFPWATAGGVSDNLLTGLGLAGIGGLGALILVFGLFGSYLPSMGGKAEYDALQLEIKTLTERRDKQLVSRERYVRGDSALQSEQRAEAASLTDDLSQVIRSKEEEARHKYRQVLWVGTPIYILVGGVLAVLLATNALQALLIGFAWTSIVGRLGLSREESQKEPIEETEIGVLADGAKEAVETEAKLARIEKENKDLKAIASRLSTEVARKNEKR